MGDKRLLAADSGDPFPRVSGYGHSATRWAAGGGEGAAPWLPHIVFYQVEAKPLSLYMALGLVRT